MTQKEMSIRGGKARSEKKRLAVLANLARANERKAQLLTAKMAENKALEASH